jgi:hypothetical protein
VCSGRGREEELTCYLECDGYALRTPYVCARDIHEVPQSLRHVAWVRGTGTLVVLGPRDKGKGECRGRCCVRTSLSSCSAVIWERISTKTGRRREEKRTWMAAGALFLTLWSRLRDDRLGDRRGETHRGTRPSCILGLQGPTNQTFSVENTTLAGPPPSLPVRRSILRTYYHISVRD